MNKKDFIKQLADALHSFVLHPLLFPELLEDLKQSGQERDFLRILLACLKYLLEVGVTATRHKEFEPLEQGIYSMHLAGAGLTSVSCTHFYRIAALHCLWPSMNEQAIPQQTTVGNAA